ncbi:cyanophycin synthetase [Viridibacterium curvum]|uniref:Cyanophycin synthetase n=1 Tax=Viridibacterium curvum TaxID=1101404 RepID=A0ABP9QY80_9RHOO
MSKRDIDILEIRALRGPNIWTYRPALEALIDIGELEDAPSNTLPGFYERLSSWLPGLVEHRCSYGERGGFLRRLEEGTWPGHILEHVTIELLNLAGQKVGFGKARSTSKRGVYKVVVRSRQDEVTRAGLLAARDLVMAAIDNKPYDVTAAVARVEELADSLCLGPSTNCIVEAATERRIPSIRLTSGNLVQLGYGARQRRVWTAETDRTSAIAESIASDKDLTKNLLASCGVPVPEGEIVASPEEAWEAAESIGLPVVVKPSDANHGRGVALNLTEKADIEAAFALAEKEGSEVIVERFVRGDEHRLLVVGGKVVAAARGEAAWVTGDGKQDVLALIESQLNSDPRRGEAEEFPLSKITLQEFPGIVLILQRQGLKPEDVPADGQRVLIQPNGNMAFDVTDKVHPDVAAVVSLAARIVGLDIAGVDLVAEDISRPLAEQRGAIVEVNAGPGLLMHLQPAHGTPRQVGVPIVDHLFPDGDNGRIPLVGVTGAEHTTRVSRLVAWLLHVGGMQAGVACREGLFLDRRKVESADSANWQAGQRLLINRNVQAAVFETPPESILAEGLPYDRCNVGVVTTLQLGDALVPFDVLTTDQLAGVLRTQVDVVLEDGAAVLNADDEAVASLAEYCDGEVIFYSQHPENPRVLEHRESGGRVVLGRDGAIVLCRKDQETPLAARVPQPMGATLAAVAAAWALGLTPEAIGSGVDNFESAFGQPASTKRRAR